MLKDPPFWYDLDDSGREEARLIGRCPDLGREYSLGKWCALESLYWVGRVDIDDTE